MKIDKRVVTALIFTLLAINVLALYAVQEPERQAAAAARQEEEAAGRGAVLFGGLCSGCHGKDGGGLVGPAVVGSQFLKRHNFKEDDADDLRKAQTLLGKTIARGRAKTVMPAWSDEEGGSLNQEQIHELVTFLLAGTVADWQEAAAHAPASSPAPAAAPAAATPSGPAPAPTAAAVGAPAASTGGAPAAGGPEAGKALFAAKGCVTCHGANAEGGTGPALAGYRAAQISTQVRTPQAMMPAFPPDRLSDDELQQIISFIESLK